MPAGHGPTRGLGLLEAFLAQRRAAVAQRWLPSGVRTGRLLDLGCGLSGWFLHRASAAEKEGLDPTCEPREETRQRGSLTERLRLRRFAVGTDPLPFAADWFDGVTLLAVLEHLPREHLLPVLREVRRVLKPSGRCVATTPVHGTEGLLHGLARVGLVSHEEIEEHHRHLTEGELRELFVQAGFPPSGLTAGRFELGMNLWIAASKQPENH